MESRRVRVLTQPGGFMAPSQARRLVRAGRAILRGERGIELLQFAPALTRWTEFSGQGKQKKTKPRWLRGTLMNGRAINRAE